MKQESCDPAIIYKHYCKICNYYTSKKSSFDKHLLSKKHSCNKYGIICNRATESLICISCHKLCNSRVTLWRHKKICKGIVKMPSENIVIVNQEESADFLEEEEEDINDASNTMVDVLIKDNTDFKNIILDLIKNNTKLQEQMMDVCKNIQPSITNNNTNTNNSHNKTFNLNFFLNEQCKNAMNLNDFVGSFETQLEDLLRIGEKGYIDGISHLILEKLKETDIYHRPFHCTDLRRDTLFIRTDDVWCKEGPGNEKMAIAIKDIGKKNFMMLNEYRKKHPDCLNYDSEFNDPYLKLLMNAAGGGVKENIDKIIKNILKQIVIDKK